MTKNVKFSIITISALMLIMSLNYLLNQDEQDLLINCKIKTKIDVINSRKWLEYTNKINTNINNNNEFKIHNLMIDGYNIDINRNINIFNRIRPLTIHIKDSSEEIATINTFEIEIKKWYLSENKWSSCPQVYSSIFYNSTFN